MLSDIKSRSKEILRLNNAKVFLVLLLFVIVSSFISPEFLSLNNLLTIVRQVSIIGIVAIGQTYVILTGGIDLSVGSTLGLVVVVIAGTIASHGLLIALIVGVVVGSVIGLVNGLGVSLGRVPAFIMTLGMLTFARGLAYLYTSGVPIQINNSLFSTFGNGYFLGIPIPIYLYIFLLIVFSLLLQKTPFGRGVYAIGSNEKAAEIAGVPVTKFKTIVYIIAGFCASIGGILYASQLGLGTPIAGELYELDTIAAVVIGGTTFAGGKGDLVGTFLGTLIMGVLANILNLTGVDPYIHELFKGIVIIGAVLLRRQAQG